MRVSRRRLVQGTGALGLGLLAGCGMLPGQAAPPTAPHRIGYLSGNIPNLTQDAFRDGLADYGLVDGQQVLVDYRIALGDADRLAADAAALVQTPVEIIVASGERAARAARDRTASIPIVIIITADPVQAGLITSLARPGGNVTGYAGLGRDLVGKRLELLRDTIPDVSRLAILFNGSNPAASANYAATAAAAQALGWTVQALDARAVGELESAFAAARRENADALFVLDDPVIGTPPQRTVDLAAEYRLPAMYQSGFFRPSGGLMSYSPSLRTGHRRAAYFVDRILKGAKPADLPVEQPREFEFVINLKTAQALGLTIPPHVLLQATEIVQ
jgi:putative tryptophan/tyrosine transport system substrate-binding protein